jgi:hypothetical protein
MLIACLAMLSKSDLVTLVFMMVCVCGHKSSTQTHGGGERGKEGGGGRLRVCVFKT